MKKNVVQKSLILFLFAFLSCHVFTFLGAFVFLKTPIRTFLSFYMGSSEDDIRERVAYLTVYILVSILSVWIARHHPSMEKKVIVSIVVAGALAFFLFLPLLFGPSVT